MHVSHLSPETLSIQAHTPLVTSQVSSADPTSLQAHAIKWIKIDYCSMSIFLLFTIFIGYLPSHVGKPKKPEVHWSHLSFVILSLQLHTPVSSSQVISWEPSSLHSQAENQ